MTDIQVLYDGPIVKRSDAKANGLKYYFTGKPCKRGHVDQRYTSTFGCLRCNVVVMARWHENNPEYSRVYYEENREKINNESREWRRKNPDKAYEYRMAYYEENKSNIFEYQREYRQDNPEKVNALNRNRSALKRDAEGTHSADDVSEMIKTQNNKCAEPTCGKDLSDGYHVDHIMPLALGGSNWPDNLQCLCPTCNMRKSAKHPYDWARENGRLL